MRHLALQPVPTVGARPRPPPPTKPPKASQPFLHHPIPHLQHDGAARAPHHPGRRAITIAQRDDGGRVRRASLFQEEQLVGDEDGKAPGEHAGPSALH